MAVLGSIAALYLTSFLDARAPLLVADRQGIRMRSGRSWRGVAWTEVERLEHLPRSGLLRDGRIVVIDRTGTATSPCGSRWRPAWSVPTGTSSPTALRDLAGDAAEVVELEPLPDDPASGPDADPPAEPTPDEDRRTAGPAARAQPRRARCVGSRSAYVPRCATSPPAPTALKRHPAEATAGGRACPRPPSCRRDPDDRWVEAVVPIGARRGSRADRGHRRRPAGRRHRPGDRSRSSPPPAPGSASPSTSSPSAPGSGRT